MKYRLLLAGLICVLGVAVVYPTLQSPVWAQEPAKAGTDAKIKELVEQLGDDDWQTREAAEKSLDAIGVPAEEPLREALKGNDPEVKMRAARLLKHISILKLGKIAFVSNRDGNNEIYVMDSEGGNQTRLTNTEADEGYPAWSPDGQKIAFHSNRDGNWEIYVMDANGQNQTRLTNNKANNGKPCWSPDGKKIAFESDRDGHNEIYVMSAEGGSASGGDANGQNQIRLTTTFKDGESGAPAWSPDGKWIAYHSNGNGAGGEKRYSIWVMEATGANPRKLPNLGGDNRTPAWSPDSKTIVFHYYNNSDEEYGGWELGVIDLKENKPKTLTNIGRSLGRPCWSSDGQKIIFHSNQRGGNNIYMMDADGKNPVRLTKTESYINNLCPAWQPPVNPVRSVGKNQPMEKNVPDNTSNGVKK